MKGSNSDSNENLTIPQIITPNQETRVTGEGFPITRASSTKKVGDLVVKWNVVFPRSLSESQKDGLKKVLG